MRIPRGRWLSPEWFSLVLSVLTLIGGSFVAWSANVAAYAAQEASYVTKDQTTELYATKEDMRLKASQEYVDRKFDTLQASVDGVKNTVDRNSKVLDEMNAFLRGVHRTAKTGVK